MYLEKAKPDKQFNYAFDNEIPLILWLAEDELKAGEVKVKVNIRVTVDPIQERRAHYQARKFIAEPQTIHR